MQLGRRRIAMRQDQASVAIAETRGRRRGDLAAGHSVRDAYVADGRGATVGAGLKGLHHSKALLVVSETTADLTYRRQLELVDELQGQRRERTAPGGRLGSPTVVADFIRDFENVFSGGSALDDAKPPVPKAAAATGSARSGPSTQTL